MASSKHARRKQQGKEDHPILKTLLVVFLLLALGFVGAWIYQRNAQRFESVSKYTLIKPIAISQHGYGISATVAVQVREKDVRWSYAQNERMELLLKEALVGLNLDAALTPGGLAAVQEEMAQMLRTKLDTDKIQAVYITDFLVSDGSH